MDGRPYPRPLARQSPAQPMEQRSGVSQTNLGGLPTLINSSEPTTPSDRGERHAQAHRALAAELSMRQGNPQSCAWKTG